MVPQLCRGTLPSRQFRDLRCVSRHRRSLVAQRSRVRNRVQKVLDRSGVRIGAVLSDIFGANGRRVLDGLVDRLDREVILASLSGHVRRKADQLGDALRLELRETDRMLLTDLLDEHECRQAPVRTRTAREQDATRGARRVRACRRAHAQLPVGAGPAHG